MPWWQGPTNTVHVLTTHSNKKPFKSGLAICQFLRSCFTYRSKVRRFLVIKVKCSCYRPGVAHRVASGTAVLFHDPGTRRGWVVSRMPQPQFTPAKTCYPMYRRLCGPHGQCGLAVYLVPIGIRSRTIQLERFLISVNVISRCWLDLICLYRYCW